MAEVDLLRSLPKPKRNIQKRAEAKDPAVVAIAKQYGVAAINWGLVAGKTQTYLPWDSWQRPYVTQQPPVWFHEVFREDGTPYREQEAAIISELTGAASRNATAGQ